MWGGARQGGRLWGRNVLGVSRGLGSARMAGVSERGREQGDEVRRWGHRKQDTGNAQRFLFGNRLSVSLALRSVL